MKVIDLLQRIANGEIPKKIMINDMLYTHDGVDYKRESDGEYLFTAFLETTTEDFNREVEIIKEEPKTTTRESIEALGYACGEIQKCFTNGWEKSLKNKFLNEEDKKIEKLKIEQDTPNSNFYIRNENGTKCGLTKHSKIIADKINEIIDVLNEMREDK